MTIKQPGPNNRFAPSGAPPEVAFHTRAAHWLVVAAGASILAALTVSTSATEPRLLTVNVLRTNQNEADPKNSRTIIVEELEPATNDSEPAKHETAWLGVATEEVPESQAAKMGLSPGQGVVITYLPEGGPAAKAGLRKKDVLTKVDDQLIVLPIQLRKLIQMHKVGDTIALTYYRDGVAQNAKATLEKTRPGTNLLGETKIWGGNLHDLHLKLQDAELGTAIREEMKRLQEALASSGLDKESVRIEVQRGLEEARKALAEANRLSTGESSSLKAASKALEELSKREADADRATITVKSRGDSVKTVVTADDDGTYVLVAAPKKRLTVHDKDGNIIFDGEVETEEQQGKVPRKVWAKVARMLEQMDNTETATKTLKR